MLDLIFSYTIIFLHPHAYGCFPQEFVHKKKLARKEFNLSIKRELVELMTWIYEYKQRFFCKFILRVSLLNFILSEFTRVIFFYF